MPFYRFEDLKDKRHNPDISSAHGPTIQGERIYFGKRFKKPGTGAKPHYHANEMFVYVLKGKLRFKVEDKEQVVSQGGIVHVPANVVHTDAVEGTEDVEYLYIKDTRGTLKGTAA